MGPEGVVHGYRPYFFPNPLPQTSQTLQTSHLDIINPTSYLS